MFIIASAEWNIIGPVAVMMAVIFAPLGVMIWGMIFQGDREDT